VSLRVGVIGAGRMGQEHLRRLAAIEWAVVTAVADANLPLAEQQASAHGARAFADPADLVRSGVDAVVIATPGKLHRAHVELALAAGLPFLLEKPVAIAMDDALAIRDAADQAGVITAVGYQWRNLETIPFARSALDGQAVTMANATWYWTTPLVAWIADRDQGGGQMVDQVTHLLDLMRHLVGEIGSVDARYSTRARGGQPGFNNWDSSAVLLHFETGAVGVVQATYALFADCPVPVMLDVISRDLLVRITSAQVEVHRPGSSTTARAKGRWGLDLDRRFVEAVRTGDRSLVLCDVAEATRSLAVSLAANRSAALGRPVEVAEVLR